MEVLDMAKAQGKRDLAVLLLGFIKEHSLVADQEIDLNSKLIHLEVVLAEVQNILRRNIT